MNSSSNAPRYDLGLNPPYQINYRAKRAGKRISASKRRITFQFGFSSASAIARGLTEKECRGCEHEIVLVWSHITGKRQLFMDSKEIHMSKAARGNTKFEYSWSTFGSHMMKIIANGTPPKQNSGERQFDLELDGMSFFEFSKIYQLGRSKSATKRASFEPSRAYSYHGVAYDARDDEEKDEELPMPKAKIDLFSQPSPLLVSPMSNCSSVPSLMGSSTSNTGSYDEFMPVEYSTQKTFESVSSQIMHAYNSKAPDADVPHSAPSSSRALIPASEEGLDQISKSMKNLVNLDDITTTAFQPISPNSPSLGAMKRGEANWGLAGRAPTLSEMRDSVAQSPTASVREAVNTGAMQLIAPLPYQGAVSPQQHGYYGAPHTNMGYAPQY